ncbi:MAG: hypothetical protein GY790_09750 [Bacteroidetes bacterium]|nr:hypothetical protein [Bacteroidota bacterium]
MAITLVSISGIDGIYRIAVFSGDGLVKALVSIASWAETPVKVNLKMAAGIPVV